MSVKKWYTLVEVLIVIIIMTIILSMTVVFGAKYLKGLQLRTEKEAVLNAINYTLSYVKSTNYYRWEKFIYFDVSIWTTGISVQTDTWSWFSQEVTLVRSTLSGESDTIRLYPYVRACEDITHGSDMVLFSLTSTTNTDSFCFERDMSLCKIFVVTCP